MMYLLLALGLLMAAVGGELFVRGTVATAIRARLPQAIVASTLAAFATSTPEMVVSITAAVDGVPQIALGDAVGSNITNIGLILGLALLVFPITIDWPGSRMNYILAAGTQMMLLLVTITGVMGRLGASALLALFLAWSFWLVQRARRNPTGLDELAEEEQKAPDPIWLITLLLISGLTVLLGAGQLIIYSAKAIGEAWGLPDYVIGVTVVALGTSVPELATVMIAQFRRLPDISLGALFGSNIFNGLFIVGIATMVRPYNIDPDMVIISVMTGLLLVLIARPWRIHGRMGRRLGLILMGIYAAHATWQILLPPPVMH